jgi:hypothetical protein
LNYPSIFKIPKFALFGFMDEVRFLMTRNMLSYHNYYHSLDVMQTCYAFIETMGAGDYVSELESFGLLIAAICHDLDHPGLNNSYQVSRGTTIALQFNDASCLENMHSYLCFEILRKKASDIFAGLEKSDRTQLRKLIIGCIINTDMTFHFALKNDLNACVEREISANGAGVGKFMKNDKDRDILLKTLLHVADISNPCKVWELSKMWSDKVIAEFFHQGDVEKSQGLAVSMNMDRDSTDQSELSLNFCDFIVAPFFISLVSLFPDMSSIVRIMANNRDQWDAIHNTMISNKYERDADKLEEELGRWDRRTKGFGGTVEPFLKDASEGDALAEQISRRKKSTTILEALVEKSSKSPEPKKD